MTFSPLPIETVEASIVERARTVRIQLARPITNRQAFVLRLIQDQPRTTGDIVARIGGCSGEAITALAGLLARNKIALSKGVWWSVKEERAA